MSKFRIDPHMLIIREVPDELKDRGKYFYQTGFRYFDTRKEAITFLRSRLLQNIKDAEQTLKQEKGRLRRFDKKFSLSEDSA